MVNIMFAICKDIYGAVSVCAWKIMVEAKRGSKRQPHLGGDSEYEMQTCILSKT